MQLTENVRMNFGGHVGQFVFEDEDGRMLEVHITHEGVIIDAYQIDFDGNDVHLGTAARTAEELFEEIG